MIHQNVRAVDQNDDRVFVGGGDGLNQFVLIARQVQVRRVQIFAFNGVVQPDHDNGDIGFARQRGGIGNGSSAGGRGARAAFGKGDGDLVAHFLFDAVQNADRVKRLHIGAPSPAQRIDGGIGANDGDGLDFRPVQRQHIARVFEQGDPFLRHLQGELSDAPACSAPRPPAACRPAGPSAPSGAECAATMSSICACVICFASSAACSGGRAVMVWVGHLHVVAGSDGRRPCHGRCPSRPESGRRNPIRF